MYKSVLSFLIAFFVVCAGLSFAATSKKKRTTKRPSSSASVVAKKSSAAKSSAQTSSVRPVRSSSKSKKKTGSSQTAASSYRRSTQQAPTQERYTEIQKALADRGYYSGEVNGIWSADSVASLKRFQQEQSLNATGKLDSVSLIALGLGPKRELTARTNPDPKLARPQDDHRRTEGSERP